MNRLLVMTYFILINLFKNGCKLCRNRSKINWKAKKTSRQNKPDKKNSIKSKRRLFLTLITSYLGIESEVKKFKTLMLIKKSIPSKLIILNSI